MGSYRLDMDWEGRTATLDALVVDETQRRGKVGTGLVERFVSLAQGQGCKAVKSRVNEKNTQAQRFHESLGFTRSPTYEYTVDLAEPR